MEIEFQRKGRNKKTTINHSYINGAEYRRKFDVISDNKELNRLIYQIAKKILIHRNGTLYEDMYWIDLDTNKVILSVTDSKIKKKIRYTNKMKNVINRYNDLLTIHSHPESFPPSLEDLNCNYRYGYKIGIVCCHNGRIFMYKSEQIISYTYYWLVYSRCYNRCKDSDVATLNTWKELQTKFEIEVKEVTV